MKIVVSILLTLSIWACPRFGAMALCQNVVRLENGLSEVTGEHCSLITDIPVDEEIRSLTKAFDKSVAKYCQFFSVDLSALDNPSATIYLIGDRKKIQALGLVPAEAPDFRDGFQFFDQLFVIEQPSAYYRRHLVVHEGVHWFMSHRFGGCGSPWFMEGMAEYLGTHRWDGRDIELAVIPANRKSVPYWGRFKLINEQLVAGKAPSLGAIFNYNNQRHRDVDAYAWSWAATTFLMHADKYRDRFHKAVGDKLDYSMDLSNRLKKTYEHDWQQLNSDWQAFANQLDYGMEINSAIPSLVLNINNELIVESNRGWQSTDIALTDNETLDLKCTGNIRFETPSGEIESLPNGVTFEYLKGYPRAALQFVVIPDVAPDAETIRAFEPNTIGDEFTAKVHGPGRLWLRVNGYPKDRIHYSGKYRVNFAQ